MKMLKVLLVGSVICAFGWWLGFIKSAVFLGGFIVGCITMILIEPSDSYCEKTNCINGKFRREG